MIDYIRSLFTRDVDDILREFTATTAKLERLSEELDRRAEAAEIQAANLVSAATAKRESSARASAVASKIKDLITV